MGFLSKAWKGVKGAVKKVASTVKKVSKKVVTAIPGGKALWKAGTKLGKGITKGIGKITSKLGPIGTMALSFVLAPVMGPALGAMWSGFGAGAQAMATSANAFVSTLGTAGQGIFAAGNWVGGTLGALGNAVVEGASNVMAGNFSGAASSFATNISNAFTGKAGMAAVHAGAAQAASTAAGNVASGESWFAAEGAGANAQFDALNADALGSIDKLAAIDPTMAGRVAAETGQLIKGPMSAEFKPMDPSSFEFDLTKQAPVDVSFQGSMNKALYGADPATMSLGQQQAYMIGGADAVRGADFIPAPNSFTDKVTDVTSRASSMQSLLGGGSGSESGYQPYVAKPINSAQIAKPMTAAGQGSAGYSLLGGVQGLEESIRRSQAMMFG